jgi:hypothetical protein
MTSILKYTKLHTNVESLKVVFVKSMIEKQILKGYLMFLITEYHSKIQKNRKITIFSSGWPI